MSVQKEEFTLAQMEPLELPPSPVRSSQATGSRSGRSLKDEVLFGSAGNASLASTTARVAQATPSSVLAIGKPPTIQAGASIAERAEGAPRVIVPKSYWEKGVWTGIYYLFQYIFMSSKKQKVMDEIYKAVDEAIKEKDSVYIEALGDALFDEEFSRDALCILFQKNNLPMIAHALGDSALADELFDRLIILAAEEARIENERINPFVR